MNSQSIETNNQFFKSANLKELRTVSFLSIIFFIFLPSIYKFLTDVSLFPFLLSLYVLVLVLFISDNFFDYRYCLDDEKIILNDENKFISYEQILSIDKVKKREIKISFESHNLKGIILTQDFILKAKDVDRFLKTLQLNVKMRTGREI